MCSYINIDVMDIAGINTVKNLTYQEGEYIQVLNYGQSKSQIPTFVVISISAVFQLLSAVILYITKWLNGSLVIFHVTRGKNPTCAGRLWDIPRIQNDNIRLALDRVGSEGMKYKTDSLGGYSKTVESTVWVLSSSATILATVMVVVVQGNFRELYGVRWESTIKNISVLLLAGTVFGSSLQVISAIIVTKYTAVSILVAILNPHLSRQHIVTMRGTVGGETEQINMDRVLRVAYAIITYKTEYRHHVKDAVPWRDSWVSTTVLEEIISIYNKCSVDNNILLNNAVAHRRSMYTSCINNLFLWKYDAPMLANIGVVGSFESIDIKLATIRLISLLDVTSIPAELGGQAEITVTETREKTLKALKNIVVLQTALELDRVLNEGIFDERLRKTTASFISESRVCSTFKDSHTRMKKLYSEYSTTAATISAGAGFIALFVLLTITTQSNVQEIGIIDNMMGLALSLLVSALITLLSTVISGGHVAYTVRQTVNRMHACNMLIMPLHENIDYTHWDALKMWFKSAFVNKEDAYSCNKITINGVPI